MTGVVGDAPAPVDIRVRCAGQPHVLHWAAGTLTAVDHPDVGRERALVALGGAPSRCLDVLETWDAHADDLDVLVLASRGVTDELPVVEVAADEAEDDDDPTGTQGAIGVQAVPTAAVMYHGRYRHGRRSGSGWLRHHRHEHDARPRNVESLLTLDRRLADRLLATVVGTWTQRISDGDPRVAAARPALQAALYGRALRSVRTWLADPTRAVELRLLGPDEQPYVAAGDAGGVLLGLGFEWLRDVWTPGLATSFGRLCLTAEPTGPTSWSLLSVGPELGEPRLMQVSW